MQNRIAKKIISLALSGLIISGALAGDYQVNAEGNATNLVKASTNVKAKAKSVKVTHTGKVNTSSLNVRSKADASSKKLGSLKNGAKVEIVSKQSNGWYKIKFKDKYGYVSGKYISSVKAVSSSNNSNNSNASSNKVTHTGTVSNTSSLNVRSKADASSTKLGSLKKGAKVEIIGKQSKGWYKIKFKDKYGYVSGKYISNVKVVNSSSNNNNNSQEAVIRTGVVNSQTIQVREKASETSKSKGKLSKGEKVEIVKIESNGWYRIKFEKGYAYVESEFIDLNKETTTKVSGLNTKPSQTAGKTLADNIEITPGNNRDVRLQMYNTSKKVWETKKTFKTKDEEVSSVKLVYPKDWYNQVSSKWRIYIPAKGELKSYTSKTIQVTAKRVYENPKGYIQLKEKITVSGAGKDLVKGTMGLRVAKVQRKLGMGRVWETVGPQTMSKVKAFQKKNKLKATGVVDLKTWKKMGFSESDWYNLDAHVTPVKTKLTATRKDLIEQMIKTAESYLGTEYIVGAAGKPGSGIDCSGLVMQSMYSIGIDPAPVSVTRHTQPGYEYESRNLWKLPTLKTVSKPQRGDLVFYQNKSGTIIHVAIYLGNDRVIESWPEKVVNWPLIHPERPLIKGYKRVIG